MFGQWFVNCHNCGFVATWCDRRRDKTVKWWNELVRVVAGEASHEAECSL